MRAVLKVISDLVDAWCMILVDEAVERYANSVGLFGARPRRNRQPRHIAALLDEVDELLPGDLRVPIDLRDFWIKWNPSTFGLFVGDGLPTMERTLSEWEASSLPNILFLVCSMGDHTLYIELACDDHPGTRLYLAEPHYQVLRLLGVGIVDMLDLVSEAYVRTGASPFDPYHEWIDLRILALLAEEFSRQIVASPQERRVDMDQPATWPRHWQLANGRTSPAR